MEKKPVNIIKYICVIFGYLGGSIIGTLIYRLLEKNTSIGELAYKDSVAALLSYVVPFIICVAILFKDLKEDIIKTKDFKRFLCFIFIGGIIFFAASSLAGLIEQLIQTEGDSINEQQIDELFKEKNLINYLMLFITIVVIGPLLEEMTFRKAVMGIFEELRIPFIVNVILSGAIFGFIHVTQGDYIKIIPYMLLGMALSIAYYKSNKNIYVSYTIHMINNLISFIISII